MSRSATLPEMVKMRRRLAERDPVEALDGEPDGAVGRRLGELPVLAAVEVVRLPELVHEPDDLVRVPDAVGGELGPDHELDRLRVVAREIDEPPEERLVEHVRPVPGERDRDQLDLVPADAQLVGELVGDDLGPAVDERNLRPADGDSHFCSSRATRSSRSSISLSTASLNARWSANAGSTYQRISRRRSALTGPPLPTIGRSAETAQSRSAWSRDGQPHLRRRHVGRPRAGRADLLLQLREQRCDIRPLLGHGAEV